MSARPIQRRFFRAPFSGRWIALLIASAMLHFMLIGWIGSGKPGLPAARDQTPTTITAQLHPKQQSAPTALPRPKPAQPKPVARAKPVPPAWPTPAPQAGEAPAGAASAPQVRQIDLAQASEAFLAMETDTPASNAQPIEASATPLSEPQSATVDKPEFQQHYKVSIPPSAVLKYDVHALRDGQMVYGSGKISWQSDGDNYTVDGEASILFFTLLNFKSTGVIDDFGVAPVFYSEKRFRRSQTNTHFHRERNTISFSASTATYPRKGGEQDRASIIWQLTGIGRGDGEKFKPGAEIDFFVAGVRDASPWRVRVIGEEQIEIGSEKVSAWHVVRIPKQGSYEQKLDIWLAPQHEWFPVKLRFTETNGEYLDMLLSNLTMAVAD